MKKIIVLLLMLSFNALSAQAMTVDARQGAVDEALTTAEVSLSRPAYDLVRTGDGQESYDLMPVLDRQRVVVKEAAPPRKAYMDRPVAVAAGGDAKTVGTDEGRAFRRHRNELAFQMAVNVLETGDQWPYYYSQIYSTSDQFKKTSTLFGLYGSHTWSLYEPVRSWRDVLAHIPTPNFIRLEFEGSSGSSNYSSYATGKKQGYEAWEIDARALFGYDCVWSPRTLFTPYIGLGYQRFTDNAGGWVDYFVYDYASYTTQRSLYYIPVGFETLTQVNDQWDVNFKLEGDAVVGGQVDYNLQDIPGTFSGSDVNTGEALTLEPRRAVSDIKGGWGFRTSVKLIRKYNRFDLYFEPFFRYWSINKTEAVQAHSFATNGKDYVSVYPDKSAYKPLWDPKSATTTFGLRMGAQF